MADIDLSGVEWTPVGSSSNPYTGTFDGGGYTISGLVIESSDKNVGFFGYISGGTVSNLTLENATVSGEDTVGGIVGYKYNGGTVSADCTNSGTIKGTGNNVAKGREVANSFQLLPPAAANMATLRGMSD